MIIDPNDSEVKTLIKTWNGRLKERQTKILELQTTLDKEVKTFQAENQMFNDEFSKKAGLPANQELLLTEILLKVL